MRRPDYDLPRLRASAEEAYEKAKPAFDQAREAVKVVLTATFTALAFMNPAQRALVLLALRKALGGASVASLARSTLTTRFAVCAIAAPLLVVEAGRFRAELAETLTALDGASTDQITSAVLAKVVEFLVALGITTAPAVGALVLGRRAAT